jgi:hypothetical protein
MARMNCTCGEVLSNSMAPNNVQLRVYTDREWDKILEQDIIESWKFPRPTYDVWRCPNCEKIYVFEEGNHVAVKIYVLEEQAHTTN